jgi:hypothetical protein
MGTPDAMRATATALPLVAAPAGWIRSRTFDLGLIGGTTLLALAAGAVVLRDPALFLPILFADLWLLGYHHVIATYTRLCFDRASARRHWSLLTWVPLAILGAVLLAVATVGLWVLTSVYLYWQWWHYTRQSYGVSQIYRRKAGIAESDDPRLHQLVIYLPAVWGILHRSHQDPGSFLGGPLTVVPVPEIAVTAAGLASVLALGCWLAARAAAWQRGELPAAHTLYVLSHVAIFGVGYLVIENVTVGWLVVNVWHNAQYLLVVWLFNTNRYRDGVDPAAPLLSTLSQPANVGRYLLLCLGATVLLYGGIRVFVPTLAAAIVISQTINFHHYVVDALIWKTRTRPIQRTLGLGG